LNTFIDLPWNLHIYILLPFIFIGVIFHFAHIANFKKIIKTKGIIVLIFFLLWFFLLQLMFFNRGDQYLFAALNFFLFYIFLYLLKGNQISVIKFFDYFLVLLALTCVLEVLLHFSQVGVFDYFKDERFNPSTLSTVHPLLSFRGRPTGFAGSVYATSAMLAGFGIYSLYQKKYVLHTIVLMALFLYATPSILIVYFGYLLISKISYQRLIILIVFICASYPILKYRLLETNELKLWLPTFATDYSAKEILIGSQIGFGVHSPKVNIGELRIFSLLVSWGAIPTLLITTVYLRARKFAKFLDKRNLNANYNEYKNILTIPLIVFLCNWHYETVMVFPNTLIISFVFYMIISRYYSEVANR